MTTFGFGLWGCGKIAHKHAELLTTHVPGAKLIGVYDADMIKAQEFAKQYGIQSLDKETFLNHQDIQVVCVLTPSGLHAPNAIEIAKHKKHLVIEKPIALTPGDAEAVIHACDEEGVRIFVVKQYRYHQSIQKLREAFDQGRFGKLIMGTVRLRWSRDASYYNANPWRGTWAMDGGVFTNQASHLIDLLEWFLGDVQSVFAYTATQLADIETEDTGVAVLKFTSGALGAIEATTATRPIDLEGSFSLLGEKGSVVVGGYSADQVLHWKFTPEIASDELMTTAFAQNPPEKNYSHKMYLIDVIQSLKENRKALVDGLEAKKSLDLITALYESSETQKEIQLKFKPKLCRLGKNKP